MRKFWSALLAAVMMLGMAVSTAGAEEAPDYVMEGYDGGSASHDWETNLFFQRMQEDTGVSFEFRQHTDLDAWSERKREIAQGENLPDVLFKAELTENETRTLAGAGILIDLTPYLEEYAPDLWRILQENPEIRRAITLPDGTIRALPAINELPSNELMWINQTWLNNLRLEMPATADELTAVLRAFRDQDPNRNGRADETPLSVLGMWELRFLGHAFGILDNDDYICLRDGQVTSDLTSEKNRAFLTWLHQLWDEGLLSHSCFSTADALRQITDSKAAVTYGMFLSSSPLSVVPSEAMNQYATLPPLVWQGEQVYRDLLGRVTRGTFALTRICPQPEKMIAWVNRLYTEEGSILIQAGREGVEYTWTEDGTWEWMDDLQTVANEVLPNATLTEGGFAPGILLRSFQEKFSDASTRTLISDMIRVSEYARMSFPLVSMTEEDVKTLTGLRAELLPWAEKRMAEFVTGDSALDETHWTEFVREAEERGLQEIISLWQRYVK